MLYNTSIALCARICRDYGLDPHVALIPHSAVVATSCPGTVDFERIKNAVTAAV
ncbi:peptidoglycan recognition protein family protein [Brevibacterium luteolum]|uniref:peptidoglycan recognition protein family protein n=1 Tax=Brevibacterium luteolum TaxID=199591 RepID=UPI003EE9ED72